MFSIKCKMEWTLSQDEVENSARRQELELVKVHLLSVERLANERFTLKHWLMR